MHEISESGAQRHGHRQPRRSPEQAETTECTLATAYPHAPTYKSRYTERCRPRIICVLPVPRSLAISAEQPHRSRRIYSNPAPTAHLREREAVVEAGQHLDRILGPIEVGHHHINPTLRWGHLRRASRAGENVVSPARSTKSSVTQRYDSVAFHSNHRSPDAHHLVGIADPLSHGLFLAARTAVQPEAPRHSKSLLHQSRDPTGGTLFTGPPNKHLRFQTFT